MAEIQRETECKEQNSLWSYFKSFQRGAESVKSSLGDGDPKTCARRRHSAASASHLVLSLLQQSCVLNQAGLGVNWARQISRGIRRQKNKELQDSLCLLRVPLFYWNQAVRKSVYERELLHGHNTPVWMFWGQWRVLWRLFHCRRAPPIRIVSKGFGRSACREVFPRQGELVGTGDYVPALVRCWHCHRTLLRRLAAYLESIWYFSFLGA